VFFGCKWYFKFWLLEAILTLVVMHIISNYKMFDATSSNGLCPKANEVVEVSTRCRKWGFKFFCDLE
jgi:hypothetical protein